MTRDHSLHSTAQRHLSDRRTVASHTLLPHLCRYSLDEQHKEVMASSAEVVQPAKELALDIQQKETQAYHLSLLNEKEDYSDFIKPKEEVSNDLYLAQVLQYEYDREYDQQVNREEKLVNGNSKVSVSFNKFKICPSWYGPDSDDEPEEIDEENRAIDSFEARERKEPVIPACGYVKHGEKMITKHDLTICGRKNAARIMNLRRINRGSETTQVDGG
ncbi:Serine/threonine-protein kinase RIO3 [Chionoecetes opilio]|uniref:Serine/threonine-protein kinase RIO3 n=1 Tax=Chionoecetes opilio TaxID=41210 RepID=A0A8J5CQ97_CHIOP|nr:Serine/threonine-protein kinase RIO3 [Chionoecetes opilio]